MNVTLFKAIFFVVKKGGFVFPPPFVIYVSFCLPQAPNLPAHFREFHPVSSTLPHCLHCAGTSCRVRQTKQSLHGPIRFAGSSLTRSSYGCTTRSHSIHLDPFQRNDIISDLLAAKATAADAVDKI